MSVLREIAVYLCVIVMLRLCEAQVIAGVGPCIDVSVVSNFNVTRFMGRWYEAARFFNIMQIGAKCVISYYMQNKHGKIGIINIQSSSLFGGGSTIEGEATPVHDWKVGKWTVRYPSLPIDIAAPYWVVDTDYHNYTLIWSCYDFGTVQTHNAWILTREKEPKSFILEKGYAAADKNGINRLYFMPTDQKNCEHDA